MPASARGSAYLSPGGMTIQVNNDSYSMIGNGRILGIPVCMVNYHGNHPP